MMPIVDEQERAAVAGGVRAPVRLAVVSDFVEEGWYSMDLAADMLVREIAAVESTFVATQVRPAMSLRFSRLGANRSHVAFNGDRLVNRFWDYPRYLRGRVASFDLFHVADHSYAHLVHALPARRTGVYCHDLDAFRSVLDPAAEPRPAWFRAMARRLLSGMRRASLVFYNSEEVRRQIERFDLVEPSRLVHAPLGVAPEFAPEGEPFAGHDGSPYLLHVGSCIPRKRIDVLLSVFAAVHNQRPDLRLLHAGGNWTAEQERRIATLGIGDAIVSLPKLDRTELAALYRDAAVVLMPSEAEGFGLPVVEALACGAPVVASDIPVLREVGGDAVTFRPVGDVAAWTHAVLELLDDPAAAPSRETRLARASLFTWREHARRVLAAYETMLDGARR